MEEGYLITDEDQDQGDKNKDRMNEDQERVDKG